MGRGEEGNLLPPDVLHATGTEVELSGIIWNQLTKFSERAPQHRLRMKKSHWSIMRGLFSVPEGHSCMKTWRPSSPVSPKMKKSSHWIGGPLINGPKAFWIRWRKMN